MYILESEGVKFWLSVLMDLQNRGVKDILIVCIDNLGGFEEVIGSIYFKIEVQSCIVYQICNMIKYVVYKDSKMVMVDVKLIYQVMNKEFVEEYFNGFEERWGKKYLIIIKFW